MAERRLHGLQRVLGVNALFATAYGNVGSSIYYALGLVASFARHAFNELVSFGAGWAQMLVYIVTVATSAFFVPHYLSIFWEPLRTNLQYTTHVGPSRPCRHPGPPASRRPHRVGSARR